MDTKKEEGYLAYSTIDCKEAEVQNEGLDYKRRIEII
jgi:hypothetical protein